MTLLGWLELAVGFSILVLIVARMFKPSRARRCDTCVFSTCSLAYPKLSCSVIKRDVPPHFVCSKWQ